jgi:hypothetical protein
MEWPEHKVIEAVAFGMYLIDYGIDRCNPSEEIHHLHRAYLKEKTCSDGTKCPSQTRPHSDT